MTDTIPFAGNPLDRCSAERRDPVWVETKLTDRSSRFLPVWRLQAPSTGDEQPRLAWATAEQVRRMEYEAPTYLLGQLDGAAHFAVDVTALQEPAETLGMAEARYGDARGLASRLPAEEAGILAQAKAHVDWHARHGYCPNCGERTEVRDAGASRKCGTCDAEHFPRTDPVVIMVVWREDRCLLGRQKAWAAGSYSALAGFVDQGETIEDAVKREVKEEVGLDVDEVRYVASQPWPFPSSLMIGCFAHATGDDYTVDAFELDTARWFERDELLRAVRTPDPALGFSVPGPIAIAHHLIRRWCDGEGALVVGAGHHA